MGPGFCEHSPGLPAKIIDKSCGNRQTHGGCGYGLLFASFHSGFGERILKVDVSRVDVWAASTEHRPGGLAQKLDALAQAGADLEFVIARRSSAYPGTGVVFVTPIKGPRQIKAARKAGFEKTKSLHGIRVSTGNKPGFGADLTKQFAEAGLNLRGFSGATIGNRAVIHVAFDSEPDVSKALHLLK